VPRSMLRTTVTMGRATTAGGRRTTVTRGLTAIVACLLASLVAAPAAPAQDTRSKILRECQEGRLTGDYSIREIRDARNNIPDDVDQYSDCRDVLSRALADRAGGGSGGGGGAGGGAGRVDAGGGGGGPVITPSTDADRQALQQAAADGGAPVEVGGKPVVPGAAGFAANATRNDLPSTLIAVLILLAAAALIAAAPVVRKRALSPLAGLGRRVLPGRSG
jgi:hypothetical protein